MLSNIHDREVHRLGALAPSSGRACADVESRAESSDARRVKVPGKHQRAPRWRLTCHQLVVDCNHERSGNGRGVRSNPFRRLFAERWIVARADYEPRTIGIWITPKPHPLDLNECLGRQDRSASFPESIGRRRGIVITWCQDGSGRPSLEPARQQEPLQGTPDSTKITCIDNYRGRRRLGEFCR